MDFTATIPDETLSHIFSCVRLIEPFSRDRSPRSRSVAETRLLGWIKITFVNRRWRRVAIDNSTFWTQLDGQLGPAWYKEFLRRSKDAPLAIDDDFRPNIDGPSKESFRKLIATQRKRIKSLHLNATLRDGLPTVDRLISSEYERLEELNLSVSDTRSPSTVALIGRCNSLLEKAPRLVRLSLALPDVLLGDIAWTIPCFTQLVSLNLYGMVSTLFAPKILDALSQMNALTRLTLTESTRGLSLHTPTPISCDHRCSGSPEDIIHLKQTHSVIMEGSIELLIHLLRHFQIPPHARIALVRRPTSSSTSLEPGTSEAFTQALYGLCASQLHTTSILSAHISFDDPSYGEAPASLSLSRGLRPSSPFAELSMRRSKHAPLSGNDIILQWMDAATLAGIIAPQNTDLVRALILHDAGLAARSTHSLLHKFTGVERLCFRTSGPSGVPLHGLKLLMDATLLPKLRFVALGAQEYTLSAILTCFAPDGPHRGLAAKRFPALENVLEARRASGKPLEAIYLHVADEVVLVEDGRIGETSCPNYEPELVLESVRQLRKVQGVEIVGKDFDVFGM
ncbi:unnamed protein product [Peniophora sp. CBMAI 1063]|nr:unnamed protein product [Peniophora sp. CBMAI 1063]